MVGSALGDAGTSLRSTAGLKFALWVTCAHAVLLPIFNTLNLMKIGIPLWLAYLYGSFLILPAVYFLALGAQTDSRVKRFDGTEIFIIFVCFWGLLNTLRFGGDMTDIAGKALRLFLVFGAYKVGRQLLTRDIAEKFLRSYAKAAAWGIAVAILILYPIGVFNVLHLPIRAVISIFSESLLVTLAVVAMLPSASAPAWLQKLGRGRIEPKWILLAGAIALLVFSGKRGNYVAAALMLVYAIALLWRSGHLTFESIRKPIAVFLLVSMVIVLGFSSDAASGALQGLPYGMRQRLDVFLSGSSGAEITANRSLEVDLALRMLGYEPYGVITGLGLGAALPGVVGRSADTIHIQPLFMTFMLGVVGLSLYVWAMFCSIRPFVFPEFEWTRQDLVVSVIAFALMVTTFTSATFLSTPILWLAIGYLARRSTELASATPKAYA